MESKKHAVRVKPAAFVNAPEQKDLADGHATEKPTTISKSIFEEAGAEDEATVSHLQALGDQAAKEESKTAYPNQFMSFVLGEDVHVPHELSALTNPVGELTEPTDFSAHVQADSNSVTDSNLQQDFDEEPDNA